MCQYIENAWQIQLFQIHSEKLIIVTHMKLHLKENWENV